MTDSDPDTAAPVPTGTPVPLQRMDVIAWWERERARILAECRAAASRITQTALDAIDAVPDRTLVLKGTRVLRPIRAQIETELAAVNQDLANSLQVGLTDVVKRIEGTNSPDKTLQETAALAAGGVGMAAAGGLALSATSLATTSSTILFVIPVVTFSWPVFLLAGAVAALLGTVSTTALVRAGVQRKTHYRTHVQSRIQAALLAEGDGTVSSWSHFRQQLDRARDTMLAQLT